MYYLQLFNVMENLSLNVRHTTEHHEAMCITTSLSFAGLSDIDGLFIYLFFK